MNSKSSKPASTYVKAVLTCGCFFYMELATAQFKEVSQTLGVDHYHKNPERMGGGAAFFDYNNDGFHDLFTTGGLKREKLYENLGDGTFTDVSEMSGISTIPIASSSGVIVGDVNNDGCDDLFISTFKPYANQLLLNNCDGTFSDVSDVAGISEVSNSTGAAFIDINEDSYLDIYVINYIENPGFIFDEDGNITGFDHDCDANFLYINQGDLTFNEEAAVYGVDNIGCGLAVAATDVNSDGHCDLYIANDFGEWILPNEAYLNLDPGSKLTSVGSEYGLDAALYGMGIAIGDLDGNHLKDYYVTNLGHNHFLSQISESNFNEMAQVAGISNGRVGDKQVTSWGTFFFDFDNDGDLDLFVANGSVSSIEFLNTVDRDPDKIFINEGNGNCSSLESFDEVGSIQSNRGAVFSDYDLDGDLDVYSVAVDVSDEGNSRGSFYENQTNQGNWVSFKLVGTNVNRNAYGALVKLYSGDIILERELYSGGTYASQSSQELHFGLGNLSKIDSISINWGAKNQIEIFRSLPLNQRIRIEQGTNLFEIMGCMDSASLSYNPSATYHTACQN
ncbi:MAG: CRTAC1 family protein, partial [Bacteroidota bacterium]